jgi:hypothetical protein
MELRNKSMIGKFSVSLTRFDQVWSKLVDLPIFMPTALYSLLLLQERVS